MSLVLLLLEGNGPFDNFSLAHPIQSLRNSRNHPVGEIICVIFPTLNYQYETRKLQGTSTGNAGSKHLT